MPVLGLLSDELDLRQPPQPEWWVRPLLPGEFRKNPDGSRSTEIEITVEDDALNEGRPTNIPSLWMTPRGVIEVPFELAVDFASKSGMQFPAFTSVDEAVEAAKARSSQGGVFSSPLSPTQEKEWKRSMRNFLKPKV